MTNDSARTRLAFVSVPMRWSTHRGNQEPRRAECTWLLRLTTPLARPVVAGIVAFLIYMLRASLSSTGLGQTRSAYFNYLADAFLHGQLSLRRVPINDLDLIHFGGQLYLYWPPFPAVIVAPLVLLFGIAVSDVAYTVVFGALSIALFARILIALDHVHLAPLSVERRGILVATCAFGTFLFILAPVGGVWYTAQIVGWGCVLLATLVALTRQDSWGYFLTGLALACALATRISLLFNGIWLLFFLLQRDWENPRRQTLWKLGCGLTPVIFAVTMLGWYNFARFGSPGEMGLQWHHAGSPFRADFAQYGVFDVHYLPTNLYYQFVAYNFLTPEQWKGNGLFWMTPVLLAAPYAVWHLRKRPLTWSLLLSCVLVYVPIGLVMGTGYFTFGPRYLLDLLMPILVLTALGMRRWRLDVLQVLMLISIATYCFGSLMMLAVDRTW